MNDMDSTGKDIQLISRTSTSPLRVIIFDKDPSERWLIGTFLRQRTDRYVETEEVDEISEIKVALNRGRADIVLVDIDSAEDSEYWLKQILESQLAPVVVLTGRLTEREVPAVCKEGAANYLFKHRMTRDDLTQTMDGALAKWRAIQRNTAHKDELERFANYDTLTGLLNRRSALRRLEEAMARARRYAEHVSIVLLDVDRFSDLNEELGRERGDSILVRISALLQTRTRQADILGRYAGDAFLVVFPHTDIAGAWVAAERVRQLVEAFESDTGEAAPHPITVSGGLSTYEVGDDVSTMTYRAESALCKAKANGRNQIEK